MRRKIINIDENKCNGCGLCVNACHEGAIELIDGKARLIGDEYCDGLGDCLPKCPTDAIQIIEKETVAYDADAVEIRQSELKKAGNQIAEHACSCPGTATRVIEKKEQVKEIKAVMTDNKIQSELKAWPIQLKLVNSKSSFLENANLLVAADCTAYAYGNFHQEFVKDHVVLIGCPKLDDSNYYKEKIEEILENNNIKSITVVRMEVPCCSGIVGAVKAAMLEAGKIVPYREVTISVDGNILN